MEVNYHHYPHLFNKYLLNISNPDDDLLYYLIHSVDTKHFFDNKLWAFLHCYNIDKFNEIYGEYIENILKYFSVIVTYSIGETIPDLNCIILKIPNKGRDIGGIIISLDYLYKNNIDFSNIMFLHSKTNPLRRKQYFEPLIKDETTILKNIGLLKNYDAIFNILIENNLEEKYASNRFYHKEILEFLGINKEELIFAEGNCMIFSKAIIDFLFKKNLKLFYNILNKNNSFDISWVKIAYNKRNIDNKNLFDDFISNIEYMNIGYNNLAVGNNFVENKKNIPDGMIEHVFERIYINIIKHLNLKYIIA
jgi:hypothetical protein